MMQSFDTPRIFMQDNSPIHKARRSMAWFARQNVELLNWPPFSPDLNPIENVWSIMENGWPPIHPRNQARWQDLRDKNDYFDNLYRSLKTRYERVIELEGNWCEY